MADNVVDKFLGSAQTYFELDSRGIGTRAPLIGYSNVYTNYIEIPTPAWYPDSFLRSLKRNSYFNMVNSSAVLGHALSTKASNDGNSLDFYEEDNSNIITGLVKSAVKSVVSTGLNQISSITKKVDSIVDGINTVTDSLFGSGKTSSFEDMINEVANNPFVANQPYVNVYGFHVTEKLRETIRTLQKICGAFASIASRVIFKNANSKTSSASAKIDDKLFSEFDDSKDTKKANLANGLRDILGLERGTKITYSVIEKCITDMIYNDKTRLHSLAEFMLDKLITGTYNMKTKLPFLPRNVFTMMSSGENGFTSNDYGYAVTRKGDRDDMKKSTYITRDITGLNTIWSEPIEWKVESAFNNPTSYASSFHIYNDTLEHTLINLFFIWSFGALTEAVTDTFFIRPPYLFTIDVPGSFRFKYCQCSMEITPCGKMRKMSSEYSTSKGDKSAFISMMTNMFNYNVNPKAIEYIPDYYKVDIKFQSILPELWNYKDSYLHDHERANIYIGKHEAGKINSIMDKFV